MSGTYDITFSFDFSTVGILFCHFNVTTEAVYLRLTNAKRNDLKHLLFNKQCIIHDFEQNSTQELLWGKPRYRHYP